MAKKKRKIKAIPPSLEHNAIYTFKKPLPQTLSLPYPIIKYIKNSPKAWKKLIKTCKYFYSVKPLYPVECLRSALKGKWSDGRKLEAIKISPKLWLYDYLSARSYNACSTKLSSFIPKICKCELQKLLIKRQLLTFNEYNFLTASGTIKHFNLEYTLIKYPDGKAVTIDTLLENLKNLETFEVFCYNKLSPFAPDTVKKIDKILSNLKSIRYFELQCLTESFDFSSITNFLMQNEKIDIHLNFGCMAPLSAAYRQILESFIDKLLANPPKKFPFS